MCVCVSVQERRRRKMKKQSRPVVGRPSTRMSGASEGSYVVSGSTSAGAGGTVLTTLPTPQPALSLNCSLGTPALLPPRTTSSCVSFVSDGKPELEVEAEPEETYAVGAYHFTTCPICLEPFTLDNPAIIVQCKHGFHLQCLESWRMRSPACPVCLTSLAGDEGHVMTPKDYRRRRRYRGDAMNPKPVLKLLPTPSLSFHTALQDSSLDQYHNEATAGSVVTASVGLPAICAAEVSTSMEDAHEHEGSEGAAGGRGTSAPAMPPAGWMRVRGGEGSEARAQLLRPGGAAADDDPHEEHHEENDDGTSSQQWWLWWLTHWCSSS